VALLAVRLIYLADSTTKRKLMECLNRLGYDIEIKLTPATDSVGRRSLAVA
jgi:hypothetical protein